MIFSILNGLNDVSLDQPDRVTGGYDIKATISTDLPISGNIEDSLNMSEISSVAGTSSIRVDVKELSGENNSYKGEKIGQGRENAKIYLEKNPKIAVEIEQVIRDKSSSITKELEGNPSPKEKISEKEEE